MSYSKHYRRSVSYSGSVSFSYPASQNGGSGSASYSGEVPVDIYINVDTDPFDNSVGRFSNTTDVLTGSVVAMNAAQCKTISEASNKISDKITGGFFGVVKSELSQQIEILRNDINAGLGKLLDQGKAVDGKKTAMEGDYNRISSRYIRLFEDLDNECHKRIVALDKSSFDLSEKVQGKLLSEPACNTAAINLLGLGEIFSKKTLIFVSLMNKKTLDVLTTMCDYITQEVKINSQVDALLFGEEISGNVSLDIPVIWSESDVTGGAVGTTNHDCFIPEYINQQGSQTITEKINMFCLDSSRADWEAIEEAEKESLNKEFNVLAEKHYANAEKNEEQRVYKTMLSLWQNSQLFSLKRSLS